MSRQNLEQTTGFTLITWVLGEYRRLREETAGKVISPSTMNTSRTVTFAIASLIASVGMLRAPYSTENNSQHKQTNCSQILDDLDATFDLRREVRQKALPHPNFKYVTAFDMYEPEAVCFTDERFGSIERYKAFGDGMYIIIAVSLFVYLIAK